MNRIFNTSRNKKGLYQGVKWFVELRSNKTIEVLTKTPMQTVLFNLNRIYSTKCCYALNSEKQRIAASIWGCTPKNLLMKCNLNPALSVRGLKSQVTENIGSKKIALWKRVVLVATTAGIVAYTIHSAQKEIEINKEKVRYEEFKKAEMGGDWTLIDHDGKERSSTEFRGQWILMYFGFTHCPDICPEELEKLAVIVKTFDADPKLPNMMPIFMTLDPKRDTPAAIKDYLTGFKCPRLLGFTASESVIKEVAKKYRAYFSKGPPDEDNDYIVDHTIIIYLINPNGEFTNYFDRSKTAEQVVKTVTDHIHIFKEVEGKKK